jgi:hypothetical protein
MKSRGIEGSVEVVGHLQVLCVPGFRPVHPIRAMAGSGRSTMMVSNVFSVVFMDPPGIEMNHDD